MYPFSKPCIPEPDEGSLIQKTWDMPIENGYWLQVQLTSGRITLEMWKGGCPLGLSPSAANVLSFKGG